MHRFIQQTRHTFYANGEKFVLPFAPIGWDDIKLDLTRSSKTDGIVLDIIQNNAFVGEAKEKLIQWRESLGADGKVKYVIEALRLDVFEVYYTGYIELTSLKNELVSVTADYVDNEFDAKFRANQKEKVEIDRLTDLEDNPIDPLTTHKYLHRNHRIFSRSELKSDDFSRQYIGDTTVVIPLSIVTAQDNNFQSVINTIEPYVINPLIDGAPSVSHLFHYNSDRDKTVTLKFDLDIGVSTYNLAQLHIYVYENGEDLDYKERIQLGSNFSTDGENVVYNNSLDFEVKKGESLMFGMFVESGTYTVAPVKTSIIQEENSIFFPKRVEDKFIDCITIYEAFKRIFLILDPKVDFKSDYLKNSGQILFSGGTLRHLEIDGEKVPLFTTSFDELFKIAFTTNKPIGYSIRQNGNRVLFELEELSYFFDKSIETDLGTLTDVVEEDNLDKIYTGVKVGYSKSGENEDVFGLQVTHTVNDYNLPVNTKENIYEITCNARASCEEEEIAWRKQYVSNPDTDTKYDKDIFIVDAFKADDNTYVAYTWQEHFSAVDGVFSADTAWNFRLSPLNCAMRHAPNFTQGFNSAFYSDKNMSYKSQEITNNLSTTLIGGTERFENGNIPLSALGKSLYGDKLVKGKAVVTYDLIKKIRGGNDKANYYGKFTYRDEQGELHSGFMSTMKAEDKMDVELYKI